MIKAVAPLALACGLLTSAAQAARLDQQSVPETGVSLGLVGTSLIAGYVLGQTFTAEAGGRLTEIDLTAFRSPYLDPLGGFTFSLENASGGPLFSKHVEVADLPTVGFVVDWSLLPQIDLTGARIGVTPGDKFKIILTVDADTVEGDAGWYFNSGSSNFVYAGGNASFGVIQQGFDYGFRTYVASVPEPRAWALLVLGVGLTGWALRRKPAERSDAALG